MTSVRNNGEVEFRFFRANASQVRLAGDFTQWQANAIAMRPEGNGWWVAKVRLDAGEYRFRYVADGHWYTDFASHGVELQKQVWNSVLLVRQAADEAQEQDTRALAA
jgi:1,4-alpha-glucan branching enzyme